MDKSRQCDWLDYYRHKKSLTAFSCKALWTKLDQLKSLYGAMAGVEMDIYILTIQ